MKRIFLLAVLLTVGFAPVTAAAPTTASTAGNATTTPQGSSPQSPTATSTPNPGTPAEYEAAFFGDPSVRIVEWDYNEDAKRFRIVFEADRPTTVFITYTTSTDTEGVSRGTSTAKPLAAGRTTVFQTVPSGLVWLSTPRSQENDTFTELEADGSSLVSGPYDGSDVRDAGIGGALAVALAVLYEAVKAKAAARERGERVA